ncbi:MAG: hypothetical protein IJT97_10445 [Bacteroidaceae bacterium]|nr:hypothetical protein [Bacteroidaceae bacterium]
MKKFLLSVVTLLAVTMTSAQAQSVLGDLDDDGRVTVDDISILIDYYLNGGEEPDTTEVVVVDTVFVEPITTWGLPLAALKNQMAEGFAGYDVANEEDGAVTYMGTGETAALTYTYYFNNDVLVGCEAFLFGVTGEAVDAQLQAGYNIVIDRDTLKAYLSEDYATVVFMQPIVYGEDTYYSVTYYDYDYLYGGDDFYMPYTEWGTELDAVKDTLTAWGYGDPYREGEDSDGNDYLLYLVGNYEGDYYFFDENQQLAQVQQLFIDLYSLEDMTEFFSEQLGWTYDGERTVGEGDETFTVVDFLSPDENTWATMFEETVNDEDGDYSILYILYYEVYKGGDEEGTEAKSRIKSTRMVSFKGKDLKKEIPAQMIRKAKVSKKAAGLKDLIKK